MNPALEVVVLHEQPVGLIGAGVQPLLPGLEPELIAADLVFQLRRPGLGLGQLLLLLRRFLPDGGQTLAVFLALALKGGVPVQQLLGGGGQGGEQCLGVGGGGGLQALPAAQLLQLLAEAAHLAGQPLPLQLLVAEGMGQLPLTLPNLLQPALPLADLAGQVVRPALLLIQLPGEPVGVFQVVLDLVFQNGDGGLPLVGVRRQLGGLEPELIRLHVLLTHLGGQLLCPAVELLLLAGDLLPLAGGRLIVGEQLAVVLAQPIQMIHPDRDLQAPQLVPVEQVFLGLGRLIPEGLHLQLQLGDLVPDAQQVVGRLLQLALGLLLPVTEPGDARRLLKDRPALLSPGGENLVDFALADDGIALPAQAGVHKQLVDVPEPAGLAVDIVFALAGAVIPAGDHDLALLHGEHMAGVIQNQGDLGIARLLPLLGAAEDHVLHLAAPEGLGGLLPHDPADGVGEVGLSAAVGADNGGDVLVKGQNRLVREGLEALYFQCF